MIRAGDVIMVRGTSLFSRAITRVLSRGRRPCLHSHDALAIEDENGTAFVVSAEPPRIFIEPAHVYLARIQNRGASWCVVRPREVFDGELDGDPAVRDRITAKRIQMSLAARSFFVGLRYPVSDLWVILKRLLHLDRVLPLIQNDRARFYCTESVKELWRSNHGVKGVLRWMPQEWELESMPAPIHTELIAERGGLHLVLESEPGFFHAIVTGGVWPLPVPEGGIVELARA